MCAPTRRRRDLGPRSDPPTGSSCSAQVPRLTAAVSRSRTSATRLPRRALWLICQYPGYIGSACGWPASLRKPWRSVRPCPSVPRPPARSRHRAEQSRELVRRGWCTRTPAHRTASLGGAEVALAESPDVLDQAGRLGDVEVETEHSDVDRDDLQAVSAGHEYRGRFVHRLDHADGRVDPRQHILRRREHGDPGVHLPACGGHIAQDEGRVVPAREWRRREAAVGRHPQRPSSVQIET